MFIIMPFKNAPAKQPVANFFIVANNYMVRSMIKK